MKFKFQSVDEDGTSIIHEFEANTWYQALDQFVKFLRGSGYLVRDNSIGINESTGYLFIEDFEFNNITTFEQD